MKYSKLDFVKMDGDIDFTIEQTRTAVITGRWTPARIKILQKRIDDINEMLSAPYGISPNGYAYRCGCEHDCCGCLSSQSLTPMLVSGLSMQNDGEKSLYIQRYTSYNY